ncbi:MAG: ABC transporter permease subunit [Dongiaceae bacterium]
MQQISEIASLVTAWLPYILAALGMTLLLASGSLVFGLALGGLVAMLQIGGNRATQALMLTYTTIVRGVPELIVVYYFYFGLSAGLEALKWLPGVPSVYDLPVLLLAYCALAFMTGALAAELFRTAYSAVPEGEILAARAFGLTGFRQFRRVLLPHIARYSIPGIGNIWVGLLKNTSLISVMGVNEIMRATNIAARSSSEPFTFYFLCAVLYLIIAILSSLVFDLFERRYACE